VLCLIGVQQASVAHGQSRSDDASPIHFGVFPYVSPQVLINRQAPLRDWLSEELQQAVSLVSATDYATFVLRTCNGDYDIVLTAPHLGRLAQRDCGQRVLATTAHPLGAAFVSRRDSGLGDVQSLRGQTLHIPSPLSMIHQVTLGMLRDAGIDPERDVTLRVVDSHNSALLAVLHDGGVGVVGVTTWDDPRLQHRDQYLEIARTPQFPGFALLGNPAKLDSSRLDALARTVLTMHTHPLGERYFGVRSQNRFVVPEPGVLEGLDPYVNQVVRILEGS